MSSLGTNYSANVASTPAPNTSTTLSTTNVIAPEDSSSLNPHPTIIVLDTPFAVGDLAPNVKYPHAYLTTLYVNGPTLQVSITYGVGTMSEDGWQPAPLVPSFDLSLSGAELVPFFGSKGDGAGALWDQVEALLYRTIQAKNARMAGKIVTV